MGYLKSSITPADVHSTIGKRMLADGMDMVLDLEKSIGSTLIDARTGEGYLDFFSFFASQALGINHPKLNDHDFLSYAKGAVVNKVSNSDVYTTIMAEFVDTFSRVAMPDNFKHLFLVSGGALAVENGLKAAFDWKVQKNFAKGIKEEKGYKVIHFKEAFHGRTGYTLSLTNTDPTKTKYFPKFDWPRISNPKVTLPLDDHLADIEAMEKKAVEEIKKAVADNPDDIAVLLIEPIQAEGGDNFFRKEFFQTLRELADEHDFLLMFDEVQTGFGLTGKMWASEHYVMPDIISFGKKAQVCGIMVSDRIDEVENNVFKVSSRINSTWGGNLVDMARSAKILEIIEEENLVENARVQGEFLLAELKKLQSEFPGIISNARGLGLLCAFDFENGDKRGEFLNACFKEKLAMLGCGSKSVRFRPALNITCEDLEKGLNIIKKVLSSMS